MGNYGVYIYSAYGFALGVLFINVVVTFLKSRAGVKNQDETAS